ncbi:RrF2 family transcriptional regulator [Muriicola sp. Z0-33]|uniref:RrF2 family transcriptional regulator n=1 Tax=Muriicola sp. Z0-33 TaxID=2816957 RepID=UPI002238770C|nr:Rrf2 family transcriptional regulator [Muriicola sp. Z0-33]MCW5517231.1 Rrf2 family transcriptional regulator [Muriicola sp. Z0-33]
MLTNACKYAIRAVIYLALNSDADKKLGAKQIASELDVPQAFLAKLLRKLSSDKLISSAKGPGGGFFLNKENLEKTVWDIITAIDDQQKLDDCFLGLVKCNSENPCPVHYIAAPFKEQLLNDFKKKTIAVMAEEMVENGTVITLNRFI